MHEGIDALAQYTEDLSKARGSHKYIQKIGTGKDARYIYRDAAGNEQSIGTQAAQDERNKASAKAKLDLAGKLAKPKEGVGTTYASAAEAGKKLGLTEAESHAVLERLIATGTLAQHKADPKFPMPKDKQVFYPKGSDTLTPEERAAKIPKKGMSRQQGEAAGVAVSEMPDSVKTSVGSLTRDEATWLATFDTKKVPNHKEVVATLTADGYLEPELGLLTPKGNKASSEITAKQVAGKDKAKEPAQPSARPTKEMSVPELAKEADEWARKLKDPNLTGTLRRVPASTLYRRPPGGVVDSEYEGKEALEKLVDDIRLHAKVKLKEQAAREAAKPKAEASTSASKYTEGQRVSYMGKDGTVKGTRGDLVMVQFDGSGTSSEGIMPERLKGPTGPVKEKGKESGQADAEKYMNRKHTFGTDKEAWAFMRRMDDLGLMAGYPSLKGNPTVSVGGWKEGEGPGKAKKSLDGLEGLGEYLAKGLPQAKMNHTPLKPRTLAHGVSPVFKMKTTAHQKPKDLGKGADASTDIIHGGKADKKSPKDFDPKALAQGIKVEMEHTNNRALAQEIAMDHLTEDPRYYSALKEMEDKLEETKKSGDAAKVDAAIRALLKKTPKPDDSQVHALAGKLGLEVDDLEERIYALAGKALGKSDLSPTKARKILHDKEVKGHPITEQQRKYFGAVASGNAKKSLDGVQTLDEYLHKSLGIESSVLRKGDNVTKWADQFMGTPYAVAALEAFKALMVMDDKERAWRESKLSWSDLDDLSKEERQRIRNQYEAKAQEFQTKRAECVRDMTALERKLIDWRITEAKKFQALGKSEAFNQERSADMRGTDILREYLAKGEMPSGDAALNQGYGNNSPNGGRLEGTGKTSGNGSSPAEGAGAEGPVKHEELDYDDHGPEGKEFEGYSSGGPKAEDEFPIKTVELELEEPGEKDEPAEVSIGAMVVPTEEGMNKALGPVVGSIPGSQRSLVAKEQAIWESKLRKGRADVRVSHGGSVYSHPKVGVLDEEAAKLAKSEDFYTGGSPSLGRARNLVEQTDLCKSCSEPKPAMFTACPHCGDNTVMHRPLPENMMGQLRKSWSDGSAPLQAPRQAAEVYYPDDK